MHIIAHRGYWKTKFEKNMMVSFERALLSGFGIETDIRDLDGIAVISHDPPRRGAITFNEFLNLYVQIGNPTCLALNIKSDCISVMIKKELEQAAISNYFCFDMSVPDSRSYFSADMNVYTRRSEYEHATILDKKAKGFWLDSFESAFVPSSEIISRKQDKLKFCIVSPELHEKPHLDAWSIWRDSIDADLSSIGAICTDFPEEADKYFSELK